MKFNIFKTNKRVLELEKELKELQSKSNPDLSKEIQSLKKSLQDKDDIITTQLSNIDELMNYKRVDISSLQDTINNQSNEIEALRKQDALDEKECWSIVASQGINIERM